MTTKIQAQEVLKIVINVPSKTLELVIEDRVLKTYPVGVGISAKYKTPEGVYSIDQKVVDPVWEHPYKRAGEIQIKAKSKANPLGKYWIGFYSSKKGSYGIHGTNQESTVGRFTSHGCVRMKNQDIEELFNLLQELEVPALILITYRRYRLSLEQNSLFLEIFPDPYKQKEISPQKILQELNEDYPEAQIDWVILEKALKEQNTQRVYQIAYLPQSLPRDLPKQKYYNPYAYNKAH